MRSKRKLWLQGLMTNAASGMVSVLSGRRKHPFSMVCRWQ
jgi:hypothetical protein